MGTIEINLEWYWGVSAYCLSLVAMYWGYRKCVKLLNRS